MNRSACTVTSSVHNHLSSFIYYTCILQSELIFLPETVYLPTSRHSVYNNWVGGLAGHQIEIIILLYM